MADATAATSPVVTQIAILQARTGQREALRDALLALVPLTRQEPGCLDYTLFEGTDTPGCFYMRESFASAAALEAHGSQAYFQAFARRFDELLARPLELVGLTWLA
jgi:quinol monooxygenase YgiN